MSASVGVDLCGWPFTDVQCLHVFVCVPVGNIHLTLLLVVPGATELQQPDLCEVTGFDNPSHCFCTSPGNAFSSQPS